MAYFKILTQNLHRGNVGHHKKSIRITSNPLKIHIRYLIHSSKA